MAAPGVSCIMWDFHGSWAAECVDAIVELSRASCPMACGILVLRPGVQPTSPALAGGFLTTEPPWKSEVEIFPFPNPGDPPIIFTWGKCFYSLVL